MSWIIYVLSTKYVCCNLNFQWLQIQLYLEVVSWIIFDVISYAEVLLKWGWPLLTEIKMSRYTKITHQANKDIDAATEKGMEKTAEHQLSLD